MSWPGRVQNRTRPDGLLFVDYHPPLVILVHAIAISVLARSDVIVLRLHLDANDLTARKSVKRNHGRQIFLERLFVLSERGRRKQRGDEERVPEHQTVSVHDVSRVHTSRAANFFGSAS